MNHSYSVIADCYDILNSHISYKDWANDLCSVLKEFGVNDRSLVLDLACGTGNITIPMAAQSYDMIGVDLSYEMLNVARSKKHKGDILWLCQDMRSFELYGTVAAVVCCLDSINYLTSKNDLTKCFKLVHNYLDPDGVFVFDINTEHKFKTVYANNHYVLEGKGVYCGWQNYFNEKNGICEFDLSFFYENEDGSYTREDELQKEKCWGIDTLTDLLKKCGFEICRVSSDLKGSALLPDSERAFFVCRAIKK